MRHLTRALAALQALCAALWLATGLSGAAYAATPLLGLYEGAGCNVPVQNASARNMLGRKEDLDTLFIDYSQTPDYAYTNADYGLGCYQGQVANVALSVPLAFTKASAGQYGLTAAAYTLADVAAGKLDAFFVHLAQSAVSHGFPNAHMRLGWEMNGGWYTWAAHGNEATFNTAFCHVKGVMQAATPTAKFTYWLNPTVAADASNEHPACISAADSGTAWDQYETWWDQSGVTAEPAAWNNVLNGYWAFGSLNSWYGSDRHAVPEMGIGLVTDSSGQTAADDPYAMAQTIALDTAAHVEFMVLWDAPAWTGYPGLLHDGSKPGETLEVLKTWGGGSLPTLLAGSSLYTGSAYKAAPPTGYHAFLAQLANGDVEQLAWGDQVGQTIQATDLTAAAAPAKVAPTAAVTKVMADLQASSTWFPPTVKADLATIAAYIAGTGKLADAQAAVANGHTAPWLMANVYADFSVISAWLATQG